jgi:DeoR family glycerol-3-phosphate regulon repressor
MQQRLFAGSATVSLLERYRADIAVLGTCALHADLGLSASQEADAEVSAPCWRPARNIGWWPII